MRRNELGCAGVLNGDAGHCDCATVLRAQLAAVTAELATEKSAAEFANKGRVAWEKTAGEVASQRDALAAELEVARKAQQEAEYQRDLCDGRDSTLAAENARLKAALQRIEAKLRQELREDIGREANHFARRFLTTVVDESWCALRPGLTDEGGK